MPEKRTEQIIHLANGEELKLLNAVSLNLYPPRKGSMRESDKQGPWPKQVLNLRRYLSTLEKWDPLLIGKSDEDRVLHLVKGSPEWEGLFAIGDFRDARLIIASVVLHHFALSALLLSRYPQLWKTRGEGRFERWALLEAMRPRFALLHYAHRKNASQAKGFYFATVKALEQFAQFESNFGDMDRRLNNETTFGSMFLFLNIMGLREESSHFLHLAEKDNKRRLACDLAKETSRNPLVPLLLPIRRGLTLYKHYFFAGEYDRAYEMAVNIEELYQIKEKNKVRNPLPWGEIVSGARAARLFIEAQRNPQSKEKLYKECLKEIAKHILKYFRSFSMGRDGAMLWRLLEICINLEMGWELPYCAEFLRHFPEMAQFHAPAWDRARKMSIPLEPLNLDDEYILRKLRDNPDYYDCNIRKSQVL